MLKRIILAFSVLLSCNIANAALQLDIVGGINEGRKVAVMPFTQPSIGLDIANIVSSDLMRSGKFTALNQSQIPNSVIGGNLNVDALEGAQVEACVIGSVISNNSNTFDLEYKIVATQGAQKGQILAHYKASASAQDMRKAAHRISDRVYQHLTGQPGAFRTRIAYVVYKHNDRYPYQLMTADYDGFNEVALVKSTQPIMTPSWSPDGKNIVYVSFEKRSPAIFIQNLTTKKRTLLSSFRGLNSSPSWSPDGSKIAMVLSKDGQPDIYYYDLIQRKLVRVTSHRAIDTEPMWASDSQSLFFTSERGGRAQVYKFSFADRQTSRVTFQGQMNLSPKPIPFSDSIIVITQQNGYRVARVDPDGSTYFLTTSSLDESPSVAPNGSMVIYSTIYQGRKGLALVSTDGRFKANLPSTAGEVSAPAWGPIVDK